MTNLEKINELKAQNESVVSLTENIAGLTEENSKRIMLNEKWLMALTDLLNLLYEHEKMVNPDKNKIYGVDVKKHIAKRLWKRLTFAPFPNQSKSTTRFFVYKIWLILFLFVHFLSFANLVIG